MQRCCDSKLSPPLGHRLLYALLNHRLIITGVDFRHAESQHFLLRIAQHGAGPQIHLAQAAAAANQPVTIEGSAQNLLITVGNLHAFGNIDRNPAQVTLATPPLKNEFIGQPPAAPAVWRHRQFDQFMGTAPGEQLQVALAKAVGNLRRPDFVLAIAQHLLGAQAEVRQEIVTGKQQASILALEPGDDRTVVEEGPQTALVFVAGIEHGVEFVGHRHHFRRPFAARPLHPAGVYRASHSGQIDHRLRNAARDPQRHRRQHTEQQQQGNRRQQCLMPRLGVNLLDRNPDEGGPTGLR